jgi:hypothetical protein
MEKEKDEMLDSTNETEESSTSEEEKEEQSTEEESKVEKSDDDSKDDSDVDSLKEKNKQLFQRAKRAEEKLKELKTAKDKGQEKTEGKITNEDEILEKAVLLNKGFTKEDIKLLDKIRKMEDSEVSLLDASNSELFLALQEKKKREQKAKEAELGASRKGTSGSTPKKPLTREDHKKLDEQWKWE